MNALVAKQIVVALATTGLEGSALALVALAICRGRVRPAWQAAIWLVVLVRFVLPWSPELPGSLADLLASARGDDASVAAPLAAGAAPIAASASAAWIGLLFAWTTCSVLILGRAVLRHRAAVRLAERAWHAPAFARAELAELAVKLGVRTPQLAIGDAVAGPHVIGALHPIIVIPPALLAEPALLRAALLHELAHVRRRDALGRAVQLVATSVFFFWPVARLASRRLDLAREAACDAWALEAGDLPRPAYARLLVAMAKLRVVTAGGELAMAAHHLDARVAAVLAAPVRARLGAGHKLAVAAFTVVALGGARTAHARAQAVPCTYTPQIAAALYTAHPEADLDGDGVLSRDEACELQAELRHQMSSSALADDAGVSPAEPPYCNRDSDAGQIPPESSCHQGDL